MNLLRAEELTQPQQQSVDGGLVLLVRKPRRNHLGRPTGPDPPPDRTDGRLTPRRASNKPAHVSSTDPLFPESVPARPTGEREVGSQLSKLPVADAEPDAIGGPVSRAR